MLILETLTNAKKIGTITELEVDVLDYLLTYFVDNGGMSCEFKHTAKDIKITMSALKGVIGSLVKKGYVSTEDFPSNDSVEQMINLTDKGLVLGGINPNEY